jgi:beta-lactamase regulating signal transducer with metallopeptidase domain
MPLLDILQSSPYLLALVDTVVKATILLAVAALLTTALRRRSAAARHLVWTCALLAALALPLLSFALPRWQMPIVTIEATQTPAASPVRADAAAAQQMATKMRSRLETVSRESDAAEVARASQPSSNAMSWPAAVAVVWIIGAALVLARLGLALAAVHWLSRRTHVVTDAPWLSMARDIAARMGVARITFRRGPNPSMPMAWGIFRPSVLMPAEADAWPADRVRVVLLHELAHVRRADCLTHMLAQAACALYWFNPLAWMASRRLRAERERACDDLVLAFGTPGPDYADQLLEIARATGSSRLSTAMAAASLAMARPSQLEGRLMSILDPSVPRTGVTRTRTTLACALALVTITPLASMQPWVQAAPAMLPATAQQQTPDARPTPPVDGVERQSVEQKAVSLPLAQNVVRDATQGAIQSATQGAIQGATQGAIQGATQGVVQGAIQGVLQSMPEAVAGALDGAIWQNPNPNPNPNPSPNPNPNPNPNRRSDEQASKADPKVVAALTEALKDTDKEVRESAMHALIRLRDPGIFQPLVEALKDASPDVRENAAFGLGQLDDKRAVAPLTAALKDASPGVRERVVFALGQLEDPAAVEALIPALRDANADVREQAAFALGQIEDERAVQPLIAAIKDTAANVREQVVFALGQIESRAAVDALIAATKDTSPNVREQAAFALGQIGDPKAIDALTAALKDASANVRQQAAFALGQIAR